MATKYILEIDQDMRDDIMKALISEKRRLEDQLKCVDITYKAVFSAPEKEQLQQATVDEKQP